MLRGFLYIASALVLAGCATGDRPPPTPIDTVVSLRAEVGRRHATNGYWEVPKEHQMPLNLFTPSLARLLREDMKRMQESDRLRLPATWSVLTAAHETSATIKEVQLPSGQPDVRQVRVEQWGESPSPSPVPPEDPVPRYHDVRDFLLVYSRIDRAWRIAGMRSDISHETYDWQNGKDVRGEVRWSIDLVPFLKNALEKPTP